MARKLHTNLLHSIQRAPMSFFERMPLGRILNRFSHDIQCADNDIKFTIMATIRGVQALVVTVVTITYTAYIFLAVLIPISLFYVFVQVSDIDLPDRRIVV